MLSQREYLKFSSKVNKLIKDCYISLKDTKISDIDSSDATLLKGSSSFTENSQYIYTVSKAKKHKAEILDLCKELPKLDRVLSGTARNNILYRFNSSIFKSYFI